MRLSGPFRPAPGARPARPPPAAPPASRAAPGRERPRPRRQPPPPTGPRAGARGYRRTMTFNEGARIDPSKVRRRRTATGGGVGGGRGVLGLFVVSQFLGVDLTGLVGGGGGAGGGTQDQGEALQ